MEITRRRRRRTLVVERDHTRGNVVVGARRNDTARDALHGYTPPLHRMFPCTRIFIHIIRARASVCKYLRDGGQREIVRKNRRKKGGKNQIVSAANDNTPTPLHRYYVDACTSTSTDCVPRPKIISQSLHADGGVLSEYVVRRRGRRRRISARKR